MRRRAFLAATVAGSSTILAGCTGGGSSGGSGGNSGYGSGGGTTGGGNSSTSTPTATPQSAQAAYPQYDWNRLDGAAPTQTTTIRMRDLLFHPAIATFDAGATVTWENQDTTPHTVTIPELGVDETVKGGEQTSVTVEAAGTYDYVCTIHPPKMLGRLVAK